MKSFLALSRTFIVLPSEAEGGNKKAGAFAPASLFAPPSGLEPETP